jgi:hypothetical protein
LLITIIEVGYNEVGELLFKGPALTPVRAITNKKRHA